jgi:hypothetical protein
MAVYLSRAHVEEAIATLAKSHRCSVANVVDALNACNGDICTACEVLVTWNVYARFTARAAAGARHRGAVSSCDLPLACAATNGVVWISRKLDESFGSPAPGVADAAVQAVVTGLHPSDDDQVGDDAGDGGNVAVAPKGGGLTQMKNVSLDQVVERLNFLSDKTR